MSKLSCNHHFPVITWRPEPPEQYFLWLTARLDLIGSDLMDLVYGFVCVQICYMKNIADSLLLKMSQLTPWESTYISIDVKVKTESIAS